MKKKEEDSSIHVLKTATCNTLTGTASLTYQIGCDEDNAIYIRISGNTGGGFFSNEWVSLDHALQALTEGPEKELTAISLYPLFRGKSVNTPSFLMAVLKHLKLVQTIKGKKRHHDLLDPKPFLEQTKKLISSKPMAKKKKTKKKTKTAPATYSKKKTSASRLKKKKITT